MSQTEETELHVMIANLETKNVTLKDDLKLMDFMMTEKNQEIEELKAKNFDLNQRILKIAEVKENPILEKLESMLDTKLDTLCGTISNQLQARLLGR